MYSQQPIIVDPSGVGTPEQIEKQRRLIRDAMMNYGSASNVGEGIGQLLNGIATGVQMRGLDKAEQANFSSGEASKKVILDNLMGGAKSTPASAPSTVSGLQTDIVSDVLNAGPHKQGGMDWLKYSNQGATRNLPVSEKLAKSLSFLPELGVQAEVFSGGQPAKGTGNKRVGSVRHDDGNAADVFFYKDGRKLDWSNPQDVPIYQDIVRKAKERGITGFGAGPGYMQPGSMHIGFGNPGVWGAGGSGRNAASWLREAYGGAPAQAPMPTFAQAAASPTATQTSMVGAGQGNRMGVAQALSGNTQVASLDPSAGMAYAAPQAQSGADKVFSAIMPQTQQAAPQMPARGGSGLDVWQGRATQGTATDGTQLTKLPSGEIQRTNRFGVTERMSPEGGASAMIGGFPQPQMQPQQVAQVGSAPMPQAAPMASQPQQGGFDRRAFMEAALNPNTPPEVRDMALKFIQNEDMKQTQEYQDQRKLDQLKLEREQLELEQLRNPGAKETDLQTNLRWRANEAGLVKGTKEYQDFILSGGQAPTAQAGDMPSNVREYEYVSKLTPEQQKQYLAIKRAQQTLDMGTSFGVLDPTNPGEVANEIPKDIAGEAAQRAVGADQGQNLALLNSMNAKMPGLEKVVAELETLADKATYTLAGQAYNEGRKQLGLDPSEGAIARTQYGAVVANQVLPLLRDTFGAQFTAAEGERLLATLGNPDVAPDEKKAVLRSFIAQKKRDIEGLSTQVGKPMPQAAPQATPQAARDATTPPQGIDADTWKYMTPEERALWN